MDFFFFLKYSNFIKSTISKFNRLTKNKISLKGRIKSMDDSSNHFESDY